MKVDLKHRTTTHRRSYEPALAPRKYNRRRTPSPREKWREPDLSLQDAHSREHRASYGEYRPPPPPPVLNRRGTGERATQCGGRAPA
eukprot:2927012-Pleurochrysis_carterae.AAC.2